MSRADNPANDVDVDLGRLFSSLVRDWQRIIVVALIATGLAFLLAWSAKPLYRAETRILIETRESVFTRPTDAAGEANSPVLDEVGVTSQVEVIGSSDILKQVARQLDLADRKEFDEAANPSLFDWMLVLAGLKSDPSEIPPEERVLSKFREKLSVYRVDNSRVIVVEFSSEDPKLAADVPNAIAKTYLQVQRDAKLASNSDATDWLEPEIADLSKRVKEAEARVAAFRAESDLLLGQNNSVLATQQLSEITSELSRVRANRAAAEARAESVRGVLQSGGSLEALPDVLSSELIQRLRERQAQLKADIADLSTTLLDNHPRIRSMRSQLTDLEAQIRREAQNVLNSLQTEAKTAQMREQQLLGDLNRMKAESARAGGEEVELRSLEREAAAQRELLESYLTRYREAASRKDRNYLPVDARVFSEATVPAEPYFPKMLPIVGAAFIASMLIMAIVTLLAELFSGRAMRPAAGARIEPVSEVAMPAGSVAEPVTADAGKTFAAPEPDTVLAQESELDTRLRWDGQAHQSVEVSAVDHLPEPVAFTPSPLGEVTIDAAAEKLISGGASRAIFVSPEGDEAAAAAVLVAREVADAGLRVLLFDLTAAGAASRPMLDSAAFPGITNLLAAEAQFTDVIHTDHYSDCHVIPVGTADPVRAMRAVDRLPIIMDSLTTAYDVVVVECGPTDAEGIRRLVSDGAEILVSVLEPRDAAIADTASALRERGYEDLTLVSPVGYGPPKSPVPGRSAA
ncbi:GumC family protein [Arvimicrobium flavum]|uniref:GumC family protein n=1 Tax=Arvimicrobium flavum TaxID=3393320 RepID=UPI00237B9D16|nr:exopolysaccharide transport family protein [Mesorhizobium shangrilense]